MDNFTHKVHNDKLVRAEGYYDKRMKALIGDNWKQFLRPKKTVEVVTDLRKLFNSAKNSILSGTTLFVYGMFDEVLPYKTEMFNVLLRNNKDVIETDDALLMQLNFDEIETLPGTEIDNVTELELVDFLWLNLCQTKNKFAPYQIMRLLDKRKQKGKPTVVYSPGDMADVETWKHHYQIVEFCNYLSNLKKLNEKKVTNFNGK